MTYKKWNIPNGVNDGFDDWLTDPTRGWAYGIGLGETTDEYGEPADLVLWPQMDDVQVYGTTCHDNKGDDGDDYFAKLRDVCSEIPDVDFQDFE